jgi:predicted permease
MVAAACAFGNSLTLPLVFLSSLLPAAAYDRAVGYTALFLAAWSPLLWSLGYAQLSSAGFATEAPGERGTLSQAERPVKALICRMHAISSGAEA